MAVRLRGSLARHIIVAAAAGVVDFAGYMLTNKPKMIKLQYMEILLCSYIKTKCEQMFKIVIDRVHGKGYYGRRTNVHRLLEVIIWQLKTIV